MVDFQELADFHIRQPFIFVPSIDAVSRGHELELFGERKSRLTNDDSLRAVVAYTVSVNQEAESRQRITHVSRLEGLRP